MINLNAPLCHAIFVVWRCCLCYFKIERELELQQTKEMLARLGKKVDNVDKMDKSGREVQFIPG